MENFSLFTLIIVGKVKQTEESQKTCQKRKQNGVYSSDAERGQGSIKDQACLVSINTSVQELAVRKRTVFL